MERSEVIKLVKSTSSQDDHGVWRSTTTVREVYCKAESVTRAEFFEGGRSGLKPEYKFVLFFGDYDGEQTILYKGVTYGVYRSYHASTDILELYVERKAGAVLNAPDPEPVDPAPVDPDPDEEPDDGDENPGG